ncbi:hypothetical protein BH11ARM2_BH11ARM2_36040 [soil metagenome]
MYAGDSDDVFVFGQPGNYEWTESWLVKTQPYIKTFQIFVSPADREPRLDYGPGTSSGPPYSYPGNGIGCWNGNAGGWESHGVIVPHLDWWTDGAVGPDGLTRGTYSVSATSVGLPAETIMTAERHKIRPYADRNISGAWDLNDVVLMGWNGDLPGQTKDTVFGAPTPTSFGSITAPYANNATFSFVDGHAAALNPIKTVNTAAGNNIVCDGTNDFLKMWDARRTQ